ncbi:MAG: hypothetical protein ACK578_02010, partial [Pirellula sp.]
MIFALPSNLANYCQQKTCIPNAGTTRLLAQILLPRESLDGRLLNRPPETTKLILYRTQKESLMS